MPICDNAGRGLLAVADHLFERGKRTGDQLTQVTRGAGRHRRGHVVIGAPVRRRIGSRTVFSYTSSADRRAEQWS
jgi:hypothetical protein